MNPSKNSNCSASNQGNGALPARSSHTTAMRVKATDKMKAGKATNLINTPCEGCANSLPMSTKLPVTCAVNKPNRATKPRVSTYPARKLMAADCTVVRTLSRKLAILDSCFLMAGTTAGKASIDGVTASTHEGNSTEDDHQQPTKLPLGHTPVRMHQEHRDRQQQQHCHAGHACQDARHDQQWTQHLGEDRKQQRESAADMQGVINVLQLAGKMHDLGQAMHVQQQASAAQTQEQQTDILCRC